MVQITAAIKISKPQTTSIIDSLIKIIKKDLKHLEKKNILRKNSIEYAEIVR
jgi:tRNA isopentenyl-2-thiomethyl-A-37 hydroxylase MiaE